MSNSSAYISSIVITTKDEEYVRDTFGDDIFEESVSGFVETSYDTFLQNFNQAFQDKNFVDMKACIHKFKTTSK